MPGGTIARSEILIEEGDESWFMFKMVFVAHYGWLRHFELSRYAEASANALIVWTETTRRFALANPGFVSTAIERPFMVLAKRDALIDSPLDALRRLEWTNVADIYWQWRVAKGMPEHVVNRPKH